MPWTIVGFDMILEYRLSSTNEPDQRSPWHCSCKEKIRLSAMEETRRTVLTSKFAVILSKSHRNNPDAILYDAFSMRVFTLMAEL